MKKRGVFVLIVVWFILRNVFVAAQEISEKEKAYQAFLQKTTVILKPYQQCVNIAFGYKTNKDKKVFSSYITRELRMLISYHIGLPKGIETYLSIPFVWEKKILQDWFEQSENKSSKTGIDDLLLGAKFILFQEKESVPDIIGTLEIEVPSESLGLESGYWSVTGGLAGLKSYDPIIIYGGLLYTYSFAKIYGEQKIQPGETVGCNFGIAFAINDKLVLIGMLLCR